MVHFPIEFSALSTDFICWVLMDHFRIRAVPLHMQYILCKLRVFITAGKIQRMLLPHSLTSAAIEHVWWPRYHFYAFLDKMYVTVYLKMF